MTGRPRTVEAGAHLAAAAYLMKHEGATALVVVDGNEPKRRVGLITEADVVRAVADGKDVNEVRIHSVLYARLPGPSPGAHCS
jgi:CBS domain-containing protein